MSSSNSTSKSMGTTHKPFPKLAAAVFPGNRSSWGRWSSWVQNLPRIYETLGSLPSMTENGRSESDSVLQSTGKKTQEDLQRSVNGAQSQCT